MIANIENRQKGFSLIELMIAVAIGLFMSAVIASVYLNMRGSFGYQEELSRLQESGRFAMEAITRDVRMAGYSGCGKVTTIANVLNGGVASPYYNFSSPIVAYEGGVSTFPTDLKNSSNASPSTGTDALVLIGTDSSNELLVSAHDTSAARFDTSVHSMQVGDVMLVTDCAHAAVFQVTGPANSTNTATSVVSGSSGTTPGNCTTYLGGTCPTAKNYQYKPGAVIARIYSNAYFVAPSVVNPARRALWRKTLVSGAAASQEMLEGVQDLQVRFGVDTNDDFSADTFLKADGITAANWPKVVSVQISILVKSSNAFLASTPQTYLFNGSSVTATDRSLYKVFTENVVLRNRTK